MKILMIAPYVTIDSRKEFTRNKTGFGYMVLDIARSVSRLEQVDLLATDTRGEAFEYDGVHLLKRSFSNYLFSIMYCHSPMIVFNLMRQYKMQRGTCFRLWYYWLMTGYLCRLLKKGKYDIVHIHGGGFSTELWMKVCKHCDQKYVVTLHGLNSFSDTVQIEPAGKQYERDFLKRVTEKEFPITVISSGMKRIIENTFGVEDCSNVTVVCNSFSFDDILLDRNNIDIRNLYHLREETQIILCVGNIGKRKNQAQLIRAFEMLQDNLAARSYILFLGGEQEPGMSIDRLSDGCQRKDHYISCGIVEKHLIHNYYNQGDGVVLMSLSEGFGLSLIEGMHFGLPSMSFTDIDAYEDIYAPEAMVGVDKHTDKAVAEGLEFLLTNRWDKEQIRLYSKKFESQNMAEQYLNVYKKEK